MTRIYTAQNLAKLLSELKESYLKVGYYYKPVLTSGFFDPIGPHHLDYLKDATRYGNIWITAVNGNDACMKKKKFYFMDEQQRAIIVSSLRHVHYTVIWPENTVDGLIEIIKPAVFCNGGNYTKVGDVNSLERSACRAVGCQVIVGVGGTKKENSSTKILEDFLGRYKGV